MTRPVIHIASARTGRTRPRLGAFTRNPSKGLIYKLREPNARKPWASILPSGVFALFETWDEAAEYQGAPLRASDHG